LVDLALRSENLLTDAWVAVQISSAVLHAARAAAQVQPVVVSADVLEPLKVGYLDEDAPPACILRETLE
jgi:hypothetical protein